MVYLINILIGGLEKYFLRMNLS